MQHAGAGIYAHVETDTDTTDITGLVLLEANPHRTRSKSRVLVSKRTRTFGQSLAMGPRAAAE